MTPRWLVLGSTGQLGGHVIARLAREGHDVLGVRRPGSLTPSFARTMCLDLDTPGPLSDVLASFRPTHVAHLAAISNPRQAANQPERSEHLECTVLEHLATWTSRHGAWLLQASTDFVFGAVPGAWHTESATPAPVNAYGRLKVRAEGVMRAHGHGTIARFGWLYGDPLVPRATTYTSLVAKLRAGEPATLIDDEFRSPAPLWRAAEAVVALGELHHVGTVHIAGTERTTPLDFARRLASHLNTDLHAVPISRLSLGDRPEDVSLDTTVLRTVLPSSAIGGPTAELRRVAAANVMARDAR